MEKFNLTSAVATAFSKEYILTCVFLLIHGSTRQQHKKTQIETLLVSHMLMEAQLQQEERDKTWGGGRGWAQTTWKCVYVDFDDEKACMP